MQDEPFQRVIVCAPGGLLQDGQGIAIAGFAPFADPAWAEIDILAVIFMIERRRKQTYDVHLGHAAIACQRVYIRVVLRSRRNHCSKLGDDMAELVELPLALNV